MSRVRCQRESRRSGERTDVRCHVSGVRCQRENRRSVVGDQRSVVKLKAWSMPSVPSAPVRRAPYAVHRSFTTKGTKKREGVRLEARNRRPEDGGRISRSPGRTVMVALAKEGEIRFGLPHLRAPQLLRSLPNPVCSAQWKFGVGGHV
jgi:hypothetical protein